MSSSDRVPLIMQGMKLAAKCRVPGMKTFYGEHFSKLSKILPKHAYPIKTEGSTFQSLSFPLWHEVSPVTLVPLDKRE